VLSRLCSGGHTSLAWACVAGLLKKTMAVLAYDLRGHGHTRTSDEQDLSLERLVDDTVHVVHAIYGAKPPPLLVIGHSLGAAIGVHVAASKRLPVAALVVVDLVEGSAVSSMSHMTTVIASRPVSFESREDAVRWSLMVGAMRNAESARCSVPDQLVHIEHTGNVENNEEHRETPSKLYRWRTDLISTQPHWSGWFCGLSSLFLSCPLPKLLMLAGSDRLDTPMMIAHMQGKLQLEVMANTGHSIQEDQPKETARKLMEFVQRHKLYSMGAAWAQTEAKGASTAAAVPQASTASAAAASSTTPQQPSAVPRASSTTPQRPPVPLFHE
jgi:protein phosphatase methylesterase 1